MRTKDCHDVITSSAEPVLVFSYDPVRVREGPSDCQVCGSNIGPTVTQV